MNIVIALIPAVCWGIFPLIASKTGGGPANQILGTGLGATLVGLIVFAIMHPTITASAFIWAFMAGACWTIGQIGQFISMKPERMGVTTTMPISAGFQLVGNSLIGMLFLGNWSGTTAKIIGLVALAIVVGGVVLTAVTDDNKSEAASVKDVLFLLVTTVGYWIYSSFPNLPAVRHVSPTALYLPEMLGILCGALIFVFATRETSALTARESWAGMIGGAIWGIAAFAYIFSAQENGTSSAFIYTQLSVVISTLGGMLFLHERKTSRELGFTLAGLVLLVVGSVITGFI